MILLNMRDNLMLLILCLLPILAVADVECTDRAECWPEGSAMHRGLLLVEQQKAKELQLASHHQALLQLVASSASLDGITTDQRLLNALESQQAAWLKYRAGECELIGSLTGAGGSWPSTYANQCAANHTDIRLRRVRAARKCIGAIAEEKRLYEQNRCLQQLAPLTNNLTQ